MKTKSDFPYPMLDADALKSAINHYCSEKEKFIFIIRFDCAGGYFIPEKLLDNRFVRYCFQTKNLSNHDIQPQFSWSLNPVSREHYNDKFQKVMDEIHLGNTFLTNLTQPTSLVTNLKPENIYALSKAPCKLWLKDQFVVFSPETFIQIRNGRIATYPMKGTIDAAIPDAENIILNDEKEKAEHATIVDLLRNDLSMVAENVHVTRYRYIEKIKTTAGELLQVSSEIAGNLPADYANYLGDILFSLLPAGSVTGAPKTKTVEIINLVEGYERGFYTGVFGYFDGENLDSAVMIRFIEQTENGLIYKSGGGITFQSEMEKEYQELIQKVYVPFF